MTRKAKKELLTFVITELSNLYPYAKIQLQFRSPFELLVATILSAQCTDERVNSVTSEMYKHYNSPEQFAVLDIEVIEKMIFSTGYYKAKARHIKELSMKLLKEFDGNVPDNMDDLLKLQGVGRKTANVILGHIYDVPAIVVDTHVTRIVNRLAICKTKDAGKIEFELMELIDKHYWVVFTHYMINFGRNLCKARTPKCFDCPLSGRCDTYKKEFSRNIKTNQKKS